MSEAKLTSEKVEWKQIDIQIFPKLTNEEEIPILKPTQDGKFQIKIVNDQGNYTLIRDMVLEEDEARQLLNIYISIKLRQSF